ncbi:MAG: efflux RND transporter periplasmic adaptor subunit [Saprospiraceae bacterium]|nr:efflux RND transporter periplasmic adaptor subunit [Saprospiraceae bacterium]
MDRPVNPNIRYTRFFRMLLYILLIGGGLVGLWWLFRNQLKTRLKTSNFVVATVQKGAVQSTISASGEVIPTYEQVLSSPIQGSIQEVLKPIGSQIKTGEQILKLDKTTSQLELERQKDELELKKNQIRRLELQRNRELFDLEIADSIKGFQVQRLKAERDNTAYLLSIGGATEEQMQDADLQLKIAQLEKRQLEHKLKIQELSTNAEIKEQSLEVKIQSHELTELENKIAKADIRAQRAGVLTWVNDRIGLPVQAGESLARLADLGHYKIMGKISDIHADKINIGLPALISINDTQLTGTVNNIRPTVENNVITFEIQLDQGNHPQLRPNMKVEVFIVLASKSNVLRVANGPAFKGRVQQPLFILRENKAIREEVQVGLSSFDFIEIKSTLQEGDQIIISDMTDYEHLKEIDIIQ